MKTENLSTLKIHKLTQEQYDRELAAGNIDESAIYLTPDEGGEEIDLSIYATKEIVESYVDAINNEKESYVNKSTVIDAESTDIQYPSAKAVYDFVNQSEHITKITETNTYIWDLPPGIYTFTATNRIQKIYFSRRNSHPCDEGAFLIVGGENYSGNLPATTTFKKSVIFLKNLNTTIAQIITGISTVTYTTAEDGTKTYNAEWDGGIIESQDNKTNILNESVTNDQYPSAKAVYDYGANIEKYSKNHLSNALKKSASAVTNLEINDVSPIAHDIVCSLNSNNLLPITKINEDVNSIEIPLGKTLPAGNYLFTHNAEKGMTVEFYDETDSNFYTLQSSNEEMFLTVSSPFNKIIIRIDNGTLKDCCPAFYLENFSIVTVTVNNQDTYTPSVQGVVTGIQSVDGDTNMTISTDIDGIEINVEYNADINQAVPSFEDIPEVITELDIEVTHGDNQIYNANVVNGVLNEVVTMVMDLQGQIDALTEILPPITESDNGKVLQVVDGKLTLVELDYSKIYVGTEEPTSTTSGDENDLYIQLDGEAPTDNEVNNEAPIDNTPTDDGEIIDDNTPATEE